MKLSLVLLVVTSLYFFVTASLNRNVIRFIDDYCTYQEVRVITAFTCSKYDTVALTKYLMAKGKYWMVSADPEQPMAKAVQPIVKRSYHKFGIFMDYDCSAGRKYLQENSARRSLNGSYYWLVWSKTKFTSEIDDLNLHVDSEMTWAFPQESSDRYILYDLYKINYSWPINATVAGHWDPTDGLSYNLTQYKYARRQDLRGILLKAGLAVNNIPLKNIADELVKPENRELDAMGTYNYKLFLLVRQMYNFSVEVVPTPLFGYVVENGKMEGLTKMLGNYEIDLSASAILINRGRFRHMDFISVPTWEFRIVALFRHPPVTGRYGEVLLTPFEMNVWTSCAGMWVVVILTIRFVSWVETSTFDFVATTQEEETVRSLSDTLMIIVGAISEQGTSLDSKWIAWRTAFLAAFILSMMVNINYSASLVSSLLNTPPKTIRTTRDLIDSSLEFGAEDISYNVPYFALNKDPLVHELYEKKMAPPNRAYYPRELAMTKLKKEHFVFHTEALNVYPEIENTFSDKEKCELTEIIIMAPEKCYPVIPWGTPLKELVSVGFRKAYEIGLVNYQNRIWRVPKPPCSIKEEFVSVDMEKISPAFLIVGAGITFALIILVGEKFAKRREYVKSNQFPQTEKNESFRLKFLWNRTRRSEVQAANIHNERETPLYTTPRPWVH